MKKGDRAFFYHTGDEKQIVGIAEVDQASTIPIRPPTKGEPWVVVDVQAVEPLPKPVTLAADQGGAAAQGHGAGEIRRLSVQPVTAGEWKLVCKMGGMK